MFSRYFVVLCVIAMFAAFTINVDAAEEQGQDVEARNPLAVRAVFKILQAGFKWAARHCLNEAAEHCKQHWRNPKAAYNCGKHFLEANRGRCAVGK